MAAAKPRGLTDRQWLIAGAAGIALYVLLAALPVVLMLLPPRPEGRTFLRELSVALAFAGLAVIGLQLVLTARLRHLKAPYGIDAVYHFHRQVSFVALGFVALHPLLLVVDDLETLRLFVFWSAPLRARFAVVALLAVGLLVGLSVWRQRVRLGYELWRRSHAVLALVAIIGSVVHVELVGNYVNTPFKRELWIAYPVVWALALLWGRLLKPLSLLRSPWRVTEVRPERGNAWTLRLEPSQGGLHFDPGQFVWLSMGSSPLAMAEHPFSVSSSAESKDSIEVTIKELGDFTSTIGKVKPGERAWVDGPYGQFSVDRHRAPAYVFIAGGVGITPIMSMLETLADRGDQRPLLLLYGAADLESMTFVERIQGLSGRLELDFVPVLSTPPPGWTGESGFVDAALLERHLPAQRDELECFVCGPEPMMRAVSSALTEVGVSPAQVRYELFGLV